MNLVSNAVVLCCVVFHFVRIASKIAITIARITEVYMISISVLVLPIIDLITNIEYRGSCSKDYYKM